MGVVRDVGGGTVSVSMLPQRSGVSVAAIRYYIREGLIHSTLDPKADDVKTMNQLRLTRGLVYVTGLPIWQARKILNLVHDPELNSAALTASVAADLPLAGARIADDADLAGTRTALASVGFDKLPDAPYASQLLAVIALAEGNGVGVDTEHLAVYTTAAHECAKSDFDHMLFGSPSREMQTVVLGTSTYDSILIGLRRLAHRELVDQLTPFQSQQKNEKEVFGVQNMIPEASTVPVAQYLCFGPSGMLCITETSAPVAGPHDLVVNVTVISINGIDTNARVGRNKFLTEYRLPQFTGPDFDGGVVGIDPQIHGFDIGQCIWEFLGANQLGKRGMAAGRIAVGVDLVAPTPTSLDLAELTALPLVRTTAWQALEKLGVESNSRLFIVGGAGGVGSMAVQVARARGAFVDTISSVRHDELFRQLGAESRSDPEPTAWSTLTGRHQAVFDATGNNSQQLRRLVVPPGRLPTVSPAGIPVSFLTKILSGPTTISMSVQPSRTGLVTLADLVEAGQLNPIIRARFPLAGIFRVRALVEAGHDEGKVIVDTS